MFYAGSRITRSEPAWSMPKVGLEMGFERNGWRRHVMRDPISIVGFDMSLQKSKAFDSRRALYREHSDLGSCKHKLAYWSG